MAILAGDHRLPFHRSARARLANEPTAMHAVLAVHHTPFRTPLVGERSIDHPEPFQRSTSGPRELAKPTAVHALLDVHDTPLSELLTARGGVGIFGIDHREPFQRSTKASPTPEPFVTDPTAVQSLGDGHETPLRELPRAPRGRCVLRTAQRAPFQSCANAMRVPAESIRYPTAMHSLLEAHDTPSSASAVAPVGVGVGWIDHRRPFQRSANVTRTLPDPAKNPTALHAARAAQDTATSRPFGTAGSGTG